jgi:small subunit ribosomal protein S21
LGQHIEVKVFKNDIERAIKILKKKIQNDGMFRELKERRAYEKPSDRKRRKLRESMRRIKTEQKKKNRKR